MKLRIKVLDDGLPAPEYAHDGDAGLDLRSGVDIILQPGERALVPTGIAIALPDGYAGFVQPRSGLAAKHGISIVNTPGLIDSKYRGEVLVVLINLDQSQPFEIKRADKVAQLVVQKVEHVQLEIVPELDETVRGSGGFGSTGV